MWSDYNIIIFILNGPVTALITYFYKMSLIKVPNNSIPYLQCYLTKFICLCNFGLNLICFYRILSEYCNEHTLKYNLLVYFTYVNNIFFFILWLNKDRSFLWYQEHNLIKYSTIHINGPSYYLSHLIFIICDDSHDYFFIFHILCTFISIGVYFLWTYECIIQIYLAHLVLEDGFYLRTNLAKKRSIRDTE